MWIRVLLAIAILPLAGSCGGMTSAMSGEPAVVCPPDNYVEGCTAKSISQAANWTQFTKTIIVRPGVYREAFVILDDGVTIKADPGAHLKGRAAEDKAAIVIKGNNTIIEGLECSGITVRDKNGACIKLEGQNLTLRNVYFHDSEEGLLTGRGAGKILIENSKFERLGRRGKAHAIYVTKDASLTIRNSQILSSKDEGHEVKSRAYETILENNIIASLEGNDSRLIDISNGGRVIIRNNVLQEGPNSVNWNLIALGPGGLIYPDNSAVIEGNTIIMDHADAILLKLPKEPMPVVMRNNVIIGPDKIEGENTWYPNREAAGLPPYPALPSVGELQAEESGTEL